MCRRITSFAARKPGASICDEPQVARARAPGPGRAPRSQASGRRAPAIPPGASSPTSSSWYFAPAAVAREAGRAAPPAASTSRQSPVEHVWRSRSSANSSAAAARAASSSSDREERHLRGRAPRGSTPRRRRSRCRSRRRARGRARPASTCSSRPASALHDRVKPVRSATASAFSTSGGATFLHYCRARSAPAAPALGSRPRRRGLARRLRGAVRRTRSAGATEQRSVPAAEDRFRVALVVVDVQNTFCTPGFELFVAGRSGTGALDDSRRLCEFVYRNLGIDHADRARRSTRTRRSRSSTRVCSSTSEGRHPEPFTTRDAPRTSRRGAGGSTRRPPTGSGSIADYAEEHLPLLHADARGGRQVQPDRSGPSTPCSAGSATRSSRRSRRRSSSTAIARWAPLDFQPKGDQPADRALLDARPGGGVRPRG